MIFSEPVKETFISRLILFIESFGSIESLIKFYIQYMYLYMYPGQNGVDGDLTLELHSR